MVEVEDVRFNGVENKISFESKSGEDSERKQSGQIVVSRLLFAVHIKSLTTVLIFILKRILIHCEDVGILILLQKIL